MTTESKELSAISPEWLPEPKDLPGDLEIIAEVIGVESTMMLSREFRGCKLYIARIDRAMRKSEDQ